LVLIPTGTGEVQRLPPAKLDYQRFAQWFPGGRRILFAASEAARSTRLWVQDVFPPGQPRAFTGEGMSLRGNSISPDGKNVAATGPDGKLAIYPVDGGAPHPIPGIETGEQLIRWSADGAQLLVYTSGRMPAPLYKVDLASGRKQPWRVFTPADPAGALSLYAVYFTPDGKSGVYSFQRTESGLKLMLGLR
jgi:WD40 repeat protein